jgi:hypothetical protein
MHLNFSSFGPIKFWIMHVAQKFARFGVKQDEVVTSFVTKNYESTCSLAGYLYI